MKTGNTNQNNLQNRPLNRHVFSLLLSKLAKIMYSIQSLERCLVNGD